MNILDNFKKSFQIDEINGEIKFLKPFDHEVRQSYTFLVACNCSNSQVPAFKMYKISVNVVMYKFICFTKNDFLV